MVVMNGLDLGPSSKHPEKSGRRGVTFDGVSPDPQPDFQIICGDRDDHEFQSYF